MQAHYLKCVWSILQQSILALILQNIKCKGDIPGCPVHDLQADIVIGGLFPVHVPVALENCQRDPCRYSWRKINDAQTCFRLNMGALTWIESMLYTINDINQNPSVLPGIKLGYLICDSLNDIAEATDIALRFHSLRRRTQTSQIRFNQTGDCTCSRDYQNSRVIYAVIGGASSKISQSVNYILSVDNIPQVSYSSTSPSLADKSHFRSFFRTIPPDTYQGNAIADIIRYFKWTYVSTLATIDDYGRLGIEALKAALKGSSVCFSIEALFDNDLASNVTRSDIKGIVSQLKRDKATVIVLFTEWTQAEAVLQEATRQGVVGKTWLASEAWGDHDFVLRLPDDVIGGMLGVTPWSGNIYDLQRHVRQLRPWYPPVKSIFMKEFWDEEFRCRSNRTNKVDGSTSPQMTSETYLETMFHEIMSRLTFSKCAHVMDATYAIAAAIDKLNCSDSRNKNSFSSRCGENIVPSDILAKLKKTQFTGVLGTPLFFDENGDPSGNYLITNLKRDKKAPNGKSFDVVGRWMGSTGILSLYQNKSIQWNNWSSKVPQSVCSLPCQPGYSSIAGSSKCCWKCVRCQKNTYKSNLGHGSCQKCPNGFLPNDNQSQCIKVTERFEAWEDINTQLLLAVSLAGFILVILTFMLFITKRETAIVKASNRELQFFMLATLTLMSTLPVVYMGRPTKLKCALQPVGFALCFVLCTAILLVRSTRYVYIFYCRHDDDKRRLRTLRSQFFSVVVLTIVPVLVVSFWFVNYPIDREESLKYENTALGEIPVYEIICNTDSRVLHIIVLGYVAMLGLVCCFLAFRARKLPENMNETKWLGMTMFTLVILWSFTLTLYQAQPSWRVRAISWTITLSVYIIWGLLFLPKITIILFYPEKNSLSAIRKQIFKQTLRTVHLKRSDIQSVSAQTLDITI